MYHAYLLLVLGLAVCLLAAVAIYTISRAYQMSIVEEASPSSQPSSSAFLHNPRPQMQNYRKWHFVSSSSAEYSERLNEIFTVVYNITDEDAEEDPEAEELAQRFSHFYRLFEPIPPNDTHTHPVPNSESLLELNKLAISPEETSSLRMMPASAGAWSAVYPHPLELPYLVPKLFQHIQGWVHYFDSDPNTELMDDFCRSLIPKLVSVHPFLNGNKRTARLLFNIVSIRLNRTAYSWDFTDKGKRHDYQKDFTKSILLGDLPWA